MRDTLAGGKKKWITLNPDSKGVTMGTILQTSDCLVGLWSSQVGQQAELSLL